MKPLKSSRRAMTLLETVVSVSILMLLSALIFNIFKTGSEAWMKAESKNELSQKLRNIINKVQLRTERSSYRSVSIGKDGILTNGTQVSVISFLQYNDDPSNRANLVKEVGHETFLEYNRYAAFVWIQKTGSLYYVPGTDSSTISGIRSGFESNLAYPEDSSEAAGWEPDRCTPRPYHARYPSQPGPGGGDPHDPSWSVNADRNYLTKGLEPQGGDRRSITHIKALFDNDPDDPSTFGAQLIATNVVYFEAIPDGPYSTEEDLKVEGDGVKTHTIHGVFDSVPPSIATATGPINPLTSAPNKNSPYIRLRVVVEDPHAKITGERILDTTTSLVFRNP